MKISVITVVFNNADTIEDTLLSVASQDHTDIEHIIVDGGSTDGTLAVIARNREKVAKLRSEPDNGMYDAINKGLKMATGDIIGLLNSDDIYAYPQALSDIANVFRREPATEVVHGDLVYVDREKTDKIVRYWKSHEYRDGLFESGWCPAHPTFYARKSAYERYGDYSLGYAIGNDVELMARFLAKHKAKSRHIPKVMVRMRTGGISNQSIGNVLEQNKEILRMLKDNGLSVNRLTFFLKKLISRFRQYSGSGKAGG